MKAGEERPCSACEAELVGARTKDGKIAPITKDVKGNGNVLLFKATGTLECRTFAGDTLAALKWAGVPLRLNHFADCPERKKFKREE